ncbi:hypothetical protein EI555_017602, partial [Monodon monoceros]
MNKQTGCDDYGGYNNSGYGHDGFDDRMRDGRGMGVPGYGGAANRQNMVRNCLCLSQQNIMEVMMCPFLAYAYKRIGNICFF